MHSQTISSATTVYPVPQCDIDFEHPLLAELNLGLRGRERLTAARFAEMYQALTERDRFITPEQARLLKLIDHIED